MAEAEEGQRDPLEEIEAGIEKYDGGEFMLPWDLDVRAAERWTLGPCPPAEAGLYLVRSRTFHTTTALRIEHCDRTDTLCACIAGFDGIDRLELSDPLFREAVWAGPLA